jgi:CheY-like chemotaxis protein
MVTNILIVDNNPDAGMKFVDALALEEANVVFVNNALQAIKNVRRETYDVIVLGDKIEKGDTFDVALEIKGDDRNKRAPVACITEYRRRAVKIINLLKPQSVRADEQDFDLAVEKVKFCLESRKKEFEKGIKFK